MADALIVTLLIVLIILVLYLIKTLTKKPEEKTSDFAQIISKLAQFETTFKEKEQTQKGMRDSLV